MDFVGPSGCGKTTLMRVIADLEKPTGGEIKVNGMTPEEARLQRAYGYVFQAPVLYPWRTVEGNLKLPLEIMGVEKAEQTKRIAEALEMVELTGFGKKFPWQLSGGMQQRVSIARALTFSPDLLLMDEPFSAVDEQTRRKFQEDLLGLVQNENKTFIFVTHSIEEAVYVSDQIAILLPRPSRVSEIIRPSGFRHKDHDQIRRDPEYLDIVDDIWASLRSYVE